LSRNLSRFLLDRCLVDLSRHSPLALAFNKERKVKLSASNGSDLVIKSGVIEKELVVAKGSNIVVGGMAVVVLIVEVVGGRVEVFFGGAVVVVCRVKLLEWMYYFFPK
jgi:hypothetical protein